MSRLDNRGIGRNEHIKYFDNFQKRNVKFVDQYVSPTIAPITFDDDQAIFKTEHIWTMGDKLWKLSQQYYGEPTYWWIIAWYNRKPTESHFSVGDVVLIPTPLERILYLYNRKV